MKPIKSNLHKIHEPTCVTHASLVTNSTPSQARSRFMVTMIWITTMSTFFTTSKPMPSWTTTWRSLKWWLLCFKVKKKKQHTPYSLLFSLGLNFQTFIDLNIARVSQIFIYERLVVFIFGNMADSLRTHIDCSYYLIHKPQRAKDLFVWKSCFLHLHIN